MHDYTIGFIGGGNMARSLVGGLIADGLPPAALLVAEPDPARRDALAQQFGVTIAADNREVAARADVVVLAVKPQVMRAVAAGIAAAGRPQTLYLSIAAGIRTADLARWLGGTPAVVRAMPNTPAMVGSGATALYANAAVDERQRGLAENCLRAVGLVQWLDDEALMDAVTALSGSGPAYVFLLIEAMEAAGVRLGLPRETARLLAIQTVFGSAKMALESSIDPATLRAQVTSPGGTTERALAAFAGGGFAALVETAMTAARDRGAELARQLGQEDGAA